MELFSQSGFLYPRSPFDMQKSLNILGLSSGEINNRALIKAIALNGQPILCQVASIGTVEEPLLQYTLFSEETISPTMRILALERLRFFLSLADDLSIFYKIGYEDPHFHPIIDRLYGYHQVKFLTPFESACWAILAAGHTPAMANEIRQRVMRSHGRFVEVNQRRYYAFPEPDDLAFLNKESFVSSLPEFPQAIGLIDVSRAFHETDLEFLRQAPYDEVSDLLQSIPGIDGWAASFVLLRGLGRMERAPITDRRLISAAIRYYGDSLPRRISLIANKYQCWQGYWAHYLSVAA